VGLVTINRMSTIRPPDPPAEPGPEAGQRPASLPARRFAEPQAPSDPDQHTHDADVERPVSPMRLEPLLPRRQQPHLLVEVDGTPATYGGLVWALREAARREAVVVAVAVLDVPDGDPLGTASRVTARTHAAAQDRAQAVLLRAIAETGVHGRSRCAVMDRVVYDALTAAARGADLVVVGSTGKALLRHTVPRPPVRRLARGA
jgi:nucleotide-binding universal stress UspA family protein